MVGSVYMEMVADMCHWVDRERGRRREREGGREGMGMRIVCNVYEDRVPL